MILRGQAEFYLEASPPSSGLALIASERAMQMMAKYAERVKQWKSYPEVILTSYSNDHSANYNSDT